MPTRRSVSDADPSVCHDTRHGTTGTTRDATFTTEDVLSYTMAEHDAGDEEGTTNTYECTECGERLEAQSYPGTCPECGGELRNISKPSEQ